MPEVCLVQMPYAAVERPSLALGILKASLTRVGIESTTLYPNLQFAEEIGMEVYLGVNSIPFNWLLGEWTFARAAFPEFTPEYSGYFDLPVLKNELATKTKANTFLARAPRGYSVQKALIELRERTPDFVDRVARRILEESPSLVGCTSTFQQHCAALAVLRRIRELSPDVVTVIGGANCEGPMGVATHRNFDWLDFVVSGEADLLFPVLTRKILEQGADIPQSELPVGVLGPELRENPGLLSHPPRVVLHQMDETPIPDFDQYFEQVSHSKLKPFIQHGLPIETARGCWWGAKSHCTFCGLNGDGMGFRSKSPDRVLEEFEYLSERHGIRDFNVVDNILDMRYLKNVVPSFAERTEPYYAFFETKANLKKDQVRLLGEAGIRYIQPGIESLHQGPLDLIGKGCTPMLNLQILKWSLEYGMRVEWLFLFGFPGEKEEWYASVAEWMPQISHFNAPSSITAVQFHRFSPYHSMASQYGLNLAPEKAYPFVYPLSEEELKEFAYYFDDHEQREALSWQVDGQTTKVMSNFYSAVIAWRSAWLQASLVAGAERPELEYRVGSDGCWTIRDTRSCAVAPEHHLGALETSMMRCADGAVNAKKLSADVSKLGLSDGSWEAIEPVVQDLISKRLMLEIDGQYLALPVPADRPSLPSHFPGGTVDIDQYLRNEILTALAANRAPIPFVIEDRAEAGSV